ncbi:MAG: hypothetical protein U0936_11680 [Planctomycetaceae bacterium]
MKIPCAPAKQTSVARNRNGILTSWTILIMLTAGAICGGLLNLMWLSAIRNQAHNCASSAALAAGHNYLSDDMLRSWQQPFEYDGRTARCQQAAVNMVDDYRAGTQLPAISVESVKVIWAENQGPTKDPALLVPDGISVEFPEECFRNQFGHVFYGLTGSGSHSASVKSTVLLEHSPVAFRAGAGQSIPMLPFAICDEVADTGAESAGGTLGYWSANVESGKGQDLYSWNTETRMFESGPDGLPEITVTIYSTASAGNSDAFIPICFSSGIGNSSDARFQQWIKTGVTGEDLASMGYKELAFPGSIPVASLKPQTLLTCRTSLQNKSGEACLIPLCSAIPTSGEVTSLTLKRPVAVRIVRVSNSANGSLKVALQPCVIATSTAVTASNPDQALNRYVYSVRLLN